MSKWLDLDADDGDKELARDSLTAEVRLKKGGLFDRFFANTTELIVAAETLSLVDSLDNTVPRVEVEWMTPLESPLLNRLMTFGEDDKVGHENVTGPLLRLGRV